MKKLPNRKGKRIHPSPLPSSPCDLLAALPAALITLAAALSPDEKEVLAYLLCGGALSGKVKVNAKKNAHQHTPELVCGCFGCYMSYWARWDASPNRHLIHLILDAVEESVEPLSSLPAGSHRRFNRHKEERFPASEEMVAPAVEEGKDEACEDDCREKEEEKNNASRAGVSTPSTVRRLVSFIGERVWGVWNE